MLAFIGLLLNIHIQIDMHYGIEYWFGDVYSGNDLGTLNIRCVRDVKNTD